MTIHDSYHHHVHLPDGTTYRYGPPDLQRTSLRALKFAAAALFVLFVTAVVFYHFVEHYTMLDALFLTAITISTVGYSTLKAMSPVGKAFTIVFIIGGLAAATVALRYGAEFILGEQLVNLLGRRRRMRDIENLRDHHIICGHGRMGQEIVRQLLRHGADLVVIERDPEQVAQLQDAGILFVAGNATDDEALLRAGVERAKSLVAVTSTDEDNLFLTLSARALNPNLYIVARCANPGAHDKFTRAGANRVISPYVTGGRQMAAALLRPVLVDFLELFLRAEEVDMDMAEVSVAPDAPFVGQTLARAAIREQCGAGVIAIRGPDERFHTNPSPDYVIRPGDVLIALGTPEQLNRLEQLAGGRT